MTSFSRSPVDVIQRLDLHFAGDVVLVSALL